MVRRLQPRNNLLSWGFVAIPNSAGDLFYSNFFGWLDSDVAASAMIGLKGLRNILGWIEKRSDENSEDKKAGHNSLSGKVDAQIRKASTRSHDANRDLPLTWEV